MSVLLKKNVAWRGFVDRDGEVVAWPTLLATHSSFHASFGTDDAEFLARWRQWYPGDPPDIDDERDVPDEAVRAIYDFLGLEQ